MRQAMVYSSFTSLSTFSCDAGVWHDGVCCGTGWLGAGLRERRRLVRVRRHWRGGRAGALCCPGFMLGTPQSPL